jgi:hypothetical protein
MSYPQKWLHGRRGSLLGAIARYGSLFLTNDFDFAEGYGDVYEITLCPGLMVFDTSDRTEVASVVRALWQDYRSDVLDPELDGIFRQFRRERRAPSEVFEILEEEIAPHQIRGNSIYDSQSFQQWLTARGVQLVLFWDEDTALVLDAQHAVCHYELAPEDW